ncbi:MAG: hypothetical protein JO262_12930 [Solirubrobacterales bacterium]|nr:hypothetical protein [Solirubrobacterales bacterium]
MAEQTGIKRLYDLLYQPMRLMCTASGIRCSTQTWCPPETRCTGAIALALRSR